MKKDTQRFIAEKQDFIVVGSEHKTKKKSKKQNQPTGVKRTVDGP